MARKNWQKTDDTNEVTLDFGDATKPKNRR